MHIAACVRRPVDLHACVDIFLKSPRRRCLLLALLFSPAVGPLFSPAVGPLFSPAVSHLRVVLSLVRASRRSEPRSCIALFCTSTLSSSCLSRDHLGVSESAGFTQVLVVVCAGAGGELFARVQHAHSRAARGPLDWPAFVPHVAVLLW